MCVVCIYTKGLVVCAIFLAACAPSCTKGAMKCDGFGSGCCTYYYDNMCVEECPSDTQVVDEDFNCVERKYSIILQSHRERFTCSKPS